MMRKLIPGYFFAGIVTSMAVLSVLGWLVGSQNIYASFVRTHFMISPESQFFMTARQIMALARDQLSKDKVAVLVGGSSVMRGTGQSLDGLWSNKLQGELGNDYQVLNLALNGGGAGGQGLYVAEALKKDGYEVIFITDVWPFQAVMRPDNSAAYGAMYFDFAARGLIDRYEEQTVYLENQLYSDNRIRLNELRIQAFLNSFLNFEDLWSYIGYEHVFTIWTQFYVGQKLLSPEPWRPRKGLADSEADCPRPYDSPIDAEMRILSSAVTSPALGAEVDASLEATIPPEMRSNAILIVRTFSPYYTDRLSPEDKKTFFDKLDAAAAKYESLGVTATVANPGFDDEDYCDRDHLTNAGAVVFAKSVAEAVESKARELGYE